MMQRIDGTLTRPNEFFSNELETPDLLTALNAQLEQKGLNNFTIRPDRAYLALAPRDPYQPISQEMLNFPPKEGLKIHVQADEQSICQITDQICLETGRPITLFKVADPVQAIEENPSLTIYPGEWDANEIRQSSNAEETMRIVNGIARLVNEGQVTTQPTARPAELECIPGVTIRFGRMTSSSTARFEDNRGAPFEDQVVNFLKTDPCGWKLGMARNILEQLASGGIIPQGSEAYQKIHKAVADTDRMFGRY